MLYRIVTGKEKRRGSIIKIGQGCQSLKESRKRRQEMKMGFRVGINLKKVIELFPSQREREGEQEDDFINIMLSRQTYLK